jgi:hypothetical protein
VITTVIGRPAADENASRIRSPQRVSSHSRAKEWGLARMTVSSLNPTGWVAANHWRCAGEETVRITVSRLSFQSSSRSRVEGSAATPCS